MTYVPYLLSGPDYPNVTWEKTTMKNIGVDFSVLKDRIWGSFDMFRNDVTNLLGYDLSLIHIYFYTCFYHALIQPNQISDVDGMYRNAADSIVKAGTGAFYSTFSLWDTYRAAHPFYTLVIPERVDGFVNSLIEQGEVQGFLPIWGLWGKENFCMIGNHGVSVIAEAYRTGFRGFDSERAFNIIKKTQTVSCLLYTSHPVPFRCV